MKRILTSILILLSRLVLAQSTDSYKMLITEIMADPSPAVALPEVEYAELLNNSGSVADLYKWVLKVNDTRYVFQEHVMLDPGAFLLVTKTGACSLLDTTIHCHSLGNFSIPNDEALLVLENDSGIPVHAVSYSVLLHSREVKRKGGWSIELADTSKYCLLDAAWASSANTAGGTPGKPNTATTERADEFRLQRAFAPDPYTCQLFFNQVPDFLSLSEPGSVEIKDNQLTIDKITLLPPLFNSCLLRFSTPMDSGLIYRLSFKAGGYCQPMPTPAREISFGLNQRPDTADIVFNEILFNASQAGGEYIELFNRSARVIDLNSLFLARSRDNGSPGEPVALSAYGRSVFPGEYLVFTKDSSWLARYYPLAGERIVKIPDMPTLPNDKGTLLLFRNDGQLIDQLSYDQHWHLPLLAEQAGVALERIDENAGAESFNWTSAAAPLYGTPGQRNSQHSTAGVVKAEFQVSPWVFTPNNDGNNDILMIRYELSTPGTMGTIRIADVSGRIVRTVINNGIMGTRGMLSWNGYNDLAQPLGTGVYIVMIDLFTLDGKKTRLREAVTLANVR